ncbi:hypothetical protein LCGC14_2823160 [marine sediment metagenome]|uniref:Uncharacterized protein n=1 Tax=marine sediment metagenome TaxID=412755 RepID=A0A0F8Z350_9ZZZZ
MNEPTATELTKDPLAAIAFREELQADGHDLPELASTMGEADARLRASIFLGIMRSIEHQMDENDAECKALVAWTKERHAERQARLDAQKGWVRMTLESLYGFMRPPKGKKSLNLIGGKIGTRAAKDTLEVEDDKALIEWVQADTHNRPQQLIRVKYEINMAETREYMEAIAERDGIGPTPPGVKLESHKDKFFATPAV